MAWLYWMRDPNYKKDIQRCVEITAKQFAMSSYESAIVDALYEHLHEDILVKWASEVKKAPLGVRGKTEAANSIRVLIKEASAIASRRGSKDLTLEDFHRAYRAKFCSVWPFCRGR